MAKAAPDPGKKRKAIALQPAAKKRKQPASETPLAATQPEELKSKLKHKVYSLATGLAAALT